MVQSLDPVPSNHLYRVLNQNSMLVLVTPNALTVNVPFREANRRVSSSRKEVSGSRSLVWDSLPAGDTLNPPFTIFKVGIPHSEYWTLKSKHLDGYALDIVPSLDGKNNWWAPSTWPGWEIMAEIAVSHKIEPGSRWKGRKDCPHFEEKAA